MSRSNSSGSRISCVNPNGDTTNQDREDFVSNVWTSMLTFVANNPSIAPENVLPTAARLSLYIAIREQAEWDRVYSQPDDFSSHTPESVAEILAEREGFSKHHSKNCRLANVNFQKVIDLKKDEGEKVADFRDRQYKIWKSGLVKLFNLSQANDISVCHTLENYKG